MKRFSHIEDYARAHNKSLSDLSFEQMDALWDEAKKL